MDIFLSYAREELAFAERLKAHLERLGLSIFHDVAGGIETGQQFTSKLNEALAETKAMVAIWTPKSLSSQWCRNECLMAQQAGKLVPVVMKNVSAQNLGVEFIGANYADLTDFTDQSQHFSWSQTLDAIASRMRAWAQTRIGDEAAETLARAERVAAAAAMARPPAPPISAVGAGASISDIQQRIAQSQSAEELRHIADSYLQFPEISLAARTRATEVQKRQEHTAEAAANSDAALIRRRLSERNLISAAVFVLLFVLPSAAILWVYVTGSEFQEANVASQGLGVVVVFVMLVLLLGASALAAYFLTRFFLRPAGVSAPRAQESPTALGLQIWYGVLTLALLLMGASFVANALAQLATRPMHAVDTGNLPIFIGVPSLVTLIAGWSPQRWRASAPEITPRNRRRFAVVRAIVLVIIAAPLVFYWRQEAIDRAGQAASADVGARLGVVIANRGVNMRSCASTGPNCPTLQTLTNGAEVELLEEPQDGWVHIRTRAPQPAEGYVVAGAIEERR